MSLAKGQTTSFVWTYTASGTGVVALQGTAGGTDHVSNNPVNTALMTGNLVTVQTGASLLVTSLVASPLNVGTGSPITVLMTVLNQGQATANNVSVTPQLVASGTGAVVLAAFTNPQPALVSTLLSGNSTVFTYVYNASLAGLVSFSGQAFATDQNTGLGVTSAAATSTA